MDETQHTFTLALHRSHGDPKAKDECISLLYDQLRAIAQAKMNNERVGHTLQATALVHEASQRLLGDQETRWEDRGHFFRSAAEAMRRILIDHARKRNSEKRGGRYGKIPLSVVDLAVSYEPSVVLDLDEALNALEAGDPVAAEVVRLRFYAGLSVAGTAVVMNISERTVAREWAYARAKLYEQLGTDGS